MNGPTQVSLHDIKAHRDVPKREERSAIDYDATADLAHVKSILFAALDKTEVGQHVLTADLAPLTAADLCSARDAIYRCMKSIKPRPNWPDAEAHKGRQDAQDNVRLLREARLFDMCAKALEKGLSFVPGLRVVIDANDGDRYKAARLRWRSEIYKDWHKPTLIMDATVQVEMLRPFWHIDRIGTFDADAPHMRVRWVRGWSGAGSTLVPFNGASKEKLKTQTNHLLRLARYIWVRSMGRKRILVICQKAVEDRLLNEAGLPTNVRLLHYGALRGIDEFKDADLLILIGRPMPSPVDAEMMAEVLFDYMPDRGPNWGDSSYYPNMNVGLRPHGKEAGPTTRLEHHPDQPVNIVRRSTCEAELTQAIGRGRGVNRTAENPLQVDIIGTVPLPIEVDEFLSWSKAEPHPNQVLLSRGDIIVGSTSQKGYWNVVHYLAPDLYSSADAARKALTRTNANNIYNIRKCPRESEISKYPIEYIRVPGSRYSVPIQSKITPVKFGTRRGNIIPFYDPKLLFTR